MTAVVDCRQNSVDIDPDWYAGQPETAEPTDVSHVPTVLTKLQKWGDYESFGQPVWPTRFIPMKTPLSVEILDDWQLSEQPKHRLTVGDLLAAQTAAGRHIGLLLDLTNHDCLYACDTPASVKYCHVNLVAKELPPLEYVREVGKVANTHWSQHKTDHIAIHCAYGFNRTGFVVCSYLIEHCGLSVEKALQSFARSRPPGVKHEKFRDELHARYGSLNVRVPQPLVCCEDYASNAVQHCRSDNCSGSSDSTIQADPAVPLGTGCDVSQQQQQQHLKQPHCQQPCDECAVAGLSSCSRYNTVPNCMTDGVPSSTCSSSTSAACCVSIGHQPALGGQCEQQQTGRLQSQTGRNAASACLVCPRSSSASKSPAPLPPLCGLVTRRSSSMSRIPARCYSSGSVGDNSSIGCSPTESNAELLIPCTSQHSSANRLATVNGVQTLLMRRQDSSGGQQQRSQQHMQESSPMRTGLVVQASAVQLDDKHRPDSLPEYNTGSGLERSASNIADAAVSSYPAPVDADWLELDPCGELTGWSQGHNRPSDNGAGYQQTGCEAELSRLLEAVQLQLRQQQRQHQQGVNQLQQCAQMSRQQQQLPAAVQLAPASAPLAENYSDNGMQQQPAAALAKYAAGAGEAHVHARHSSQGSSACEAPGLKVLDNDSFGNVLTADLLKGLRGLQQRYDAN